MRAILFDVFGTLVDWRSSLIEQFQALERELGGTLPCVELTDRWRQQYKPAMDRVRNGQAPWQHLDQLHRQSLEALAGEFGQALDEALLQRITGFWHRLRPWPDTLAGMHALKADYWLAALSNGNTALMLDVARHAGLPWDMLLCADLFGHYKPDPQVYLGACRLLDLPPQEVMLCAAHNYDLKAARALGLKTAFIARPLEYGPGQSQDLAAEQDWDLIASDLLDLHRQLAASA
ncbi:TPA: haloacid dehalogenase type II [Pseudomonas aeruginosa]